MKDTEVCGIRPHTKNEPHTLFLEKFAIYQVSTTIHTAMKREVSMASVIWTILLLFTVTLVYYLFAQRNTNGLNRYPGPWLASVTNFWHRLDVKTNRHQHHLLELHRRHGDVVRIGPNKLSIATPECVAPIYGVSHEFLKVQFPLALNCSLDCF